MPSIIEQDHPSVLSWVVKNSDCPDNNDSPVIDRLLITFALLISIALPLTCNVRFLSRTLWPKSTAVVIYLTMLLTCLALSLSITILVLGFQKRISLDAFSGAIFALSPALLSVRIETFQFYLIAKVMEKRRSLNIPISDFRYVRHSQFPCNVDDNQKNWTNDFHGKCKLKYCNVKLFIRHLPRSQFYRERVLSWNLAYFLFKYFRSLVTNITQHSTRKKERGEINPSHTPANTSLILCPRQADIENQQSNPETPSGGIEEANENSTGDKAGSRSRSRKLEEQFHGLRTGHSRNFVELRDKNEGMVAWWWFNVTGSFHLLTKPSIFQISGRRRVINALILLSDIISIGDMVKHCRGDFIQNEFCTNKGVARSITATPGIVCNLLFEELGIGLWGPVVSEYRTEYPSDDDRKFYGILFLILAEKSQLFADLSNDTCNSYDLPTRSGFKKYELTDKVQILDEDSRLPLLLEFFKSPEGGKGQASVIWPRVWTIFEKMRTGIFGEPKRRARLSAQEILDDLKTYGDLAPEQFTKLMENRVDKWLNDWGIRKNSIDRFQKKSGESSVMAANESAPAGLRRFLDDFSSEKYRDLPQKDFEVLMMYRVDTWLEDWGITMTSLSANHNHETRGESAPAELRKILRGLTSTKYSKLAKDEFRVLMGKKVEKWLNYWGIERIEL